MTPEPTIPFRRTKRLAAADETDRASSSQSSRTAASIWADLFRQDVDLPLVFLAPRDRTQRVGPLDLTAGGSLLLRRASRRPAQSFVRAWLRRLGGAGAEDTIACLKQFETGRRSYAPARPRTQARPSCRRRGWRKTRGSRPGARRSASAIAVVRHSSPCSTRPASTDRRPMPAPEAGPDPERPMCRVMERAVFRASRGPARRRFR